MEKEIGQPTVGQPTKEKEKIAPSGGSSVINDYNKDDGEYKINVIKDYHGGLDITHLNKKDPNFQYRWLNSNKANLAKKTHNILSAMGGWQLCGRTHLKEKLGIAEPDIGVDGLYYRGSDLVLAFMPIELYKEKEAMKQIGANAPVDAIHKKLKDGSPTEGIQTKSQLGLK